MVDDIHKGMDDIEKKLQDAAKKLLKDSVVDCVIGYEKSGGNVVPCFVENPADAKRLVWNTGCIQNLSVYLKDVEGRVAVVAKGCDSRSIVELIKQNQVDKDKVVVLGISCEGMKDASGKIYDKCKNCAHPNPLIYDIFLGDEKKGADADYSDIVEIESMTIEQRRKFWKDQFKKCIKCYACRNICPMCYCEKCALEDKKWVSKSDRYDDVWMFHLVRAFHIAGRCTNCGECERACPVNIPLGKIYKKIEKDIKELFGYEAGVSIDDEPPMAAFDVDKD